MSREISGRGEVVKAGRPCRRQRRSSAGWASRARVQCATALPPVLSPRQDRRGTVAALGSCDWDRTMRCDAGRAELSLHPFLFLIATPAPADSMSRERGGGGCGWTTIALSLPCAGALAIGGSSLSILESGTKQIHSSTTSCRPRPGPFPVTETLESSERSSCIQRPCSPKSGASRTNNNDTDACPLDAMPTDLLYPSASVASASR